MSKNHIWIVERKLGRFWLPMCNEAAYTRTDARNYARKRRYWGYEVRVVKYIKA